MCMYEWLLVVKVFHVNVRENLNLLYIYYVFSCAFFISLELIVRGRRFIKAALCCRKKDYVTSFVIKEE